MKKKLTRLTKILLVLCLVVSELSSVGLVFAEGPSTKFDAELNVNAEDQYNPTITLKSNDLYEVVEGGNYTVEYTEEYTYLDGTTDTIYEGTITDTDLASKLNSEEGYLLTLYGTEGKADTFNGLYTVTLELYESGVLVDTTEVGLEYDMPTELHTKVVMEREGELTVLEEKDGVILVPKDLKETDTLMLISVLLTGDLSPKQEYTINGKKYTGLEVTTANFAKDSEGNDMFLDYLPRLGGVYEYHVGVSIEGIDPELVQFENTVKVAYQDYAYNDTNLNEISNITDTPLVFSTNENGEGYVYTKVLTKEEAMTVADVKAFLDNALTEEIEYTLSYLDETEVLDTDPVSNNLVITLTSDSYGYKNTIKYTFSLLGDTNNDGILDMQDVESWLSDNYGVEDATDLSLDMDNDGEVSLEDLAYLAEVIKKGTWDVTPEEIEEENAIVDAKLTTESETITTDDEFTVGYVLEVGKAGLSGFEGILNYDKTKLELLGISKEMVDELENPESNTDYWVGKVDEDKFIYLTNSSNGYTEGSYEVLRFTFRALEATETTTITLDNTKYVSGLNNISENSLTPLEVTINASSNNNLKSIVVGDNSLELTEGVYEYSIEVENDVDSISVLATAENIGSIIAMDVPEELAVGSNVIKITVIAENGESRDYFITVVRKDAQVEETDDIIPINNVVNDNNNDTTIEDVEPDNEDNNKKDDTDDKKDVEEETDISKYIIVVLIVLVIIGLIYLIFKEDSNEKKALDATKDNNPKNRK